MKTFLQKHRRVIVVTIHLVLTVVSNLLAVLLRFDGTFPQEHIRPVLQGLPWLLAIRGASFWAFGLYEGLWRYASLWDLNRIILSVALARPRSGCSSAGRCT